ACWTLPPGLGDCLAFDPAGALRSFRFETADARVPPFTANPPAEHPRVCRQRELAPGAAPRLVAELPRLNRHVYRTAAAPDGSWFLADGVTEGPGGSSRWVLAFGWGEAGLRWRLPSRVTGGGSELHFDGAGRVAAISTGDSPQ